MQAPQLLEAMRSELTDIGNRLADGDLTETAEVYEYIERLCSMIRALSDTLENDGPYPNYKLISRIHKQYVDHMEGV